MSPEEKELLTKSLELAEENNKILKALHKHMRIRRALSIAYWVLVIGLAVGAFYFLEPFVQQIQDAYGGARSNLDSFNTFFQNFNSE
ncbi:MAG: hypothetical protein WD991_01515 [Candidatus Paceibacterota bacterium]